jgi:hypothetical protein
VILTGIEVYGSVSFLVQQEQPSYLVLGGAIVTATTAILLPLAERMVRERRFILAVCLLAAMVPALSIIVCAAVERTGGARDATTRSHQASAATIALKAEVVTEAKAALEDLRADESRECNNSAKPGADPRGPRCKSAEKRTEAGRERLATARSELGASGVATKDPIVTRLAAVLPVSEADIALYHPLVLPLTISLLGILLIAAGAHQPKRCKADRRRGKRKRRVRAKAKTMSQPSSAKVIPMRRTSA